MPVRLRSSCAISSKQAFARLMAEAHAFRFLTFAIAMGGMLVCFALVFGLSKVSAGKFTAAVAVYAVGLGFFGLQKSLVPWFQAQNDMKTPLRISVYTVCLNAVLNILAVACLPVEWRHVGLAASTTLCAGCGCVLLACAARRRNGSLGMRRLAAPVAKMLFGSALMATAVVAVKASVNLPPVFSLAAAIAVGGGVYFASMAAMGMRWRRSSGKKSQS